MKNAKILFSFTRGHRLKLLMAIISVAISTYFMIQIPFIIKFTIDSIIGSETPDLSSDVIALLLRLKPLAFYKTQFIYVALAIIGYTLLRGLFQFLKAKFSADAGNKLARQLRERLYQHIQSLSYNYHVKVDTGDLLQRCTSDIDTIRRFVELQFVEMGTVIFLLTMVVGSMLRINVKLTLISTFTFPLVVILSIYFFKRINRVFKEVDEQEARVSTLIQENLSGVRVVRAFGRQKYELDRFDIENDKYSDQIYNLIKEYGRYWPTQDMIVFSQRCISIVAGIYLTINGTITLGTFIAFTTLLGYITWPLRTFGRILSELSKALVSSGRLQEVLVEPSEFNSSDIVADLNGDIVFKDVDFSYDASNRAILKSINLRIKQGETLAILGPTGAGKSTLVHLLTRFYEPSSGTITMGEKDIATIDKHHLRHHVALVLQEPFLFAKSIDDNIKISRTDATSDMVESAAVVADIHDNIIAFDKGYQTLVGEKGVSLSGGQKQRMAIARKVITNAPVLIFDDSLSAVDTETDAAIRARLRDKANNLTTIIISHRIATLSEADHIIVIEDGKITEEGVHEALLANKKLYYKVWKIQDAQAIQQIS